MASNIVLNHDSIGDSVQVPTPILINGFLQSCLQGVIFVQVARYCATRYDNDSRWMRIYVVFIGCLSLLQTILEDYKLWRVAIFRKLWETSSIQWSEFLLNGLIGTVCSAYFIRRCWKVTNKNNWVLFLLGIFSISLLVANIVMAVTVQKASKAVASSALKLMRSSVIAYYYWTYGTLVRDVLLTAILTVFLWRSRTGLRSSDKVLLRILAIAWESALLPAISMIVAIGIYHNDSKAENQLVLFFFILTGKLYTLGLLRTLNSRVNLRERLKSHDLGRTSLGNWQWDQGTTTEETRSDSTLPSVPPELGRQRPPILSSSTSMSPRLVDSGNAGFSPIASRVVFAEDSEVILFSSPRLDAKERGIACRKADPGRHKR